MPPQSRGNGNSAKPYPTLDIPELSNIDHLDTFSDERSASAGSQSFGGSSIGTSEQWPSIGDGATSSIEMDGSLIASEDDEELLLAQQNGDEDDSVSSANDDDGHDNISNDPNARAKSNPPPRPGTISRSPSYIGPAAFAPPFYNRPPTPLPPSPSLTSLLRPPFGSQQTSRPTTPDSSDAESTPTSTAAAVAKSARKATTVPRATPKIPTYEYYGFVLYLASSVAFVMYLLWSYLPTPFLHQLGIYYYPNRWWSLAVPSYLVMSIIYIYVALASYNTTYLTLPMTSIENMVDNAAQIAIVDSHGRIIRSAHSWIKNSTAAPARKGKQNTRAVAAGMNGGRLSPRRSETDPYQPLIAGQTQLDWHTLWAEGTDAVMDVPLGGVNEILYGAPTD